VFGVRMVRLLSGFVSHIVRVYCYMVLNITYENLIVV